MRDYNNRGGGRDNRGGGRGGSRFGGGRDRGPREMHDTVCSNCGNDCKVPFRPTGEKPVYCSSCFEEKGGGNDRGGRDRGGRDHRGGGDRRYGGRDGGDRRPSHRPAPDNSHQLKDIEKKLETILDIVLKIKKSTVEEYKKPEKVEIPDLLAEEEVETPKKPKKAKKTKEAKKKKDDK